MLTLCILGPHHNPSFPLPHPPPPPPPLEQAEQAVTSQRLPYASLWRPGLLERGDLARGGERLFARLLNSVAASQVAHAMVADAERWHAARSAAGASAVGAAAEPLVRIFEMKEIQQYV